jgi:phage terminase large subunit
MSNALFADDEIDITLHEKQWLAYNSKARITLFLGGLQSGKTTLGGVWINKQSVGLGPGDNLLVTCPSYKILQQSTLPWLLTVLKGSGTYLDGKQQFLFDNGSKLFIRSVHDPDSIEGITNVKAIWADEIGKCLYRSWVNILGRSAFLQCPIFLTTTPYSTNFLFTEVYKPWKEKRISQDYVNVIQLKSIENPYFSKQEYELQRSLMTPAMFARKYDGTFSQLAGLVYPDWSTDNIVPRFPSIHRLPAYAGVDLGYQDPFAIIVGIPTTGKEGPTLRLIREHYQQYLSLSERIQVMKGLAKEYNIKYFYIDSSDPVEIKEMTMAGLPAVAVKKGPGSIEAGIKFVTELIRMRRLVVESDSCKNLLEELEQYSYPDPKDGKPASEIPIDMYNHALDALRYLVTSIWYSHLQIRHKEVKAPPTHLEQAIARSKQRQHDWYDR